MQPKNQNLKTFFSNPISRRTGSEHDRFIEALFRSIRPSYAPGSSSKVEVLDNGKKKKKRGSFVVLDESEDEEDESGKSVEEDADDEDDIVEVNEPDGCGDDDDDDDDIVELGEEEKKEEESFVPVGVGLKRMNLKRLRKDSRVAGRKKGKKKAAVSSSEDEHVQKEEPVTQVEEKEPFLYKFNFGIEVPKPVELTKEQKFEEALWKEFDFIKSSAIGSFASPVDAKDLNEPKIRTDPSSLCIKGEHDFILDEQIGILCRFCKFVKTEIKYVLPPFDTSRCYDRSPKKKYAKDSEMSMWEGFSFDDAGGDSQGSFDDFQG